MGKHKKDKKSKRGKSDKGHMQGSHGKKHKHHKNKRKKSTADQMQPRAVTPRVRSSVVAVSSRLCTRECYSPPPRDPGSDTDADYSCERLSRFYREHREKSTDAFVDSRLHHAYRSYASSSIYHRSEHDVRWETRSGRRPAYSRECDASFWRCRRDSPPGSSSLRTLGATNVNVPRSFLADSRNRFTGYHFQDSGQGQARSRSCSPLLPAEADGQIRRSPPKDMPEHLRWLHNRWLKYDCGFFTECAKREASDAQANLPSSSNADDSTWEQRYLKALEETDPYLEDVDSYKRLKLELKVKVEEEKASSKLKALQHASYEDEKPFKSRDRVRRRSRSRSRSPSQSARARMMNRYSQPYHDFWRKSALQSGVMSFKIRFEEYLMSLPEEVEDHEEAVRRYNKYRLAFKRQALAEFFEAHKTESWFREKYHPGERECRFEQRCKDIHARCDVFMRLLILGWIDVELCETNSRFICKTLDAVMVLLEGGVEDMLSSLSDLDYYLEEKRAEEFLESSAHKRDDGNAQDKDWTDEAVLLESHLQSIGNRPDSNQLELMQHARDYSFYIREKLKEVEDMPDFVGTELEMLNVNEPANKKHLRSGLFVFEPKEKGLNELSLHKASALLIKNIPPSVDQAELHEMLAQLHGGYLRVMLTEPDPLNRYHRNAIASFWHNANLAKIAWRIRGYKLRGSPLLVVEHKDFTKRIHVTDGLTSDKSVVLRDIQLAKSLIQFLDGKYRLWVTTAPECEQKSAVAMVNPLLINLDSIIQENLQCLMFENEEPKLGKSAESEVQRDAGLIKLLDRLLLYLRIVFSVDYYACKIYEMEDYAPRRMGAMHIRGKPQSAATPKNLAKYIKEFEDRLKQMVPSEQPLSDAEIEQLGGKELEPEIAAFCAGHVFPTRDGIVQCSICQKRFTSQRFTEQHIREKHKDEIYDILQDTFYFNFYLSQQSVCPVKLT